MRAIARVTGILAGGLLGAACAGDDAGTGAEGTSGGASTAATEAGSTTTSTSATTSGASTGDASASAGPSESTGDASASAGTSESRGDASTSAGATTGDATTGDATTGDATTGDVTTGEPGLELPWGWIAAIDQGIRDDAYGLGGFQAPRQGYKHSGIDLLMPVGTALYAPCSGSYLAGYDGGYGNWVQVICPVPATIAGDAIVFASLLYAHLDAVAVPITGIDPNKAGKVSQGQSLGGAGKTGNAGAAGIHAHLHFEVALHGSELAGLEEAHISGADGDNAAAAALRASLAASCLEPTGLTPKATTLNLGRRIDPFIFLSCLSAEKPPLMTPQIQPLHAWSDDYAAATFDVDVGMK